MNSVSLLVVQLLFPPNLSISWLVRPYQPTSFGRGRFAPFIDLLRFDHESLNFRLHLRSCIISWHPVLVIVFCVFRVPLFPFYHSSVLVLLSHLFFAFARCIFATFFAPFPSNTPSLHCHFSECLRPPLSSMTHD